MDILGKTEFDDGSIILQIKLSEEEREEWLVNVIALSYLLKPKTMLEEIVEKDKSLVEPDIPPLPPPPPKRQKGPW